MARAGFQTLASLLVSAVCSAALAGCGGGGGEPPTDSAVIARTTPTATPSASPSATPTATPTPTPTPTASPSSQTASCGLTPVFMEEFNDLSVSANKIGPARWTAHTPWNGDFGDARFLDPSSDGPFKVENGILSITAKKDSSGKWTSGLMAAADASGAGSGTRYGYFEARMKMPPGPGLWPAFWLHSLKPVAGSGNGDVELDVFEHYSQFPTLYHTVTHVWYLDQSKTRGVDKTITAPNGLVNDYHTFGIDISPTTLTYFLDGAPVWTDTTPAELKEPMYPIINLALGGGWPIDGVINPSVMLVDYVHVYGRDGAPPAGCSPGPPK